MAWKKWLVVLEEKQVLWVKQTVKETGGGINGSTIIREGLERLIKDKGFKAELKSIKLKMELQAINDKKASLLEQEQRLKKELQDERQEVTV